MSKDDLNHILRRYAPEGSPLHTHANRLYEILGEIRKMPGSRPVTAAVRAADCRSLLDDYLQQARPGIGTVHNLFDPDIASKLAGNCAHDLTAVVDTSGSVAYSNVRLPMDELLYLRKHGIRCDLAYFMGYAPDERGPDRQAVEALCASDRIGGSVAFITLGRAAGCSSPEISIFYAGDRIFNDHYREMHWAEADDDVSERKATVIPFYRGFRNSRRPPWETQPVQELRQYEHRMTGTDGQPSQL